MPLNGFASYVPTADQFNSHWEDVDADRASNTLPPLTLQGDYARADFVTQRDELDQAIIAVEGLENAREIATDNRDTMKEGVRDRLSQFRDAVSLHLKTSAYFGAMPTLPSMGIAESKFLRRFDDMSDLWGRINADTTTAGFTPPLLLRAGYALATFQTELQALRDQFKLVTEAENDISIGRRRRDALLVPLRERMLQYRRAIELEYAEGHPLRESLPDLYASGGGGVTLPEFVFNWLQSDPSTVLIWFTMIAGLVDVLTLHAREGTSELSFQVDGVPPGQTVQATWVDATISGEVDEVTLRNSAGVDIARGVFDSNLPNPGP